KVARRFAEHGVQVIASLARGIDAAAHIGAGAAEGVSFGILDGGFDHIEAKEEMPLAIDIAREGGIITEYPPDLEKSDKHLPAVNRLIVGLAQGVVVTEVYSYSTRTRDLLRFCRQIGKLAFLVIDPEHGALAEEESLAEAVACGAIPLTGLDKVDDIIRTLV
ncbi:MAG: DNA-processing protein DprA, partial [Candidatus Zixiibacteriota bacterium]